MSIATLANAPATQLTFAWALPLTECEPVIVADRQPATRRVLPTSKAIDSTGRIESRTVVKPTPASRVGSRAVNSESSACVASNDVSVCSLGEAMAEDRIGKPFRVGAVMFRLLKSYGITDEEIAEGAARFAAKRN